MLLLHTGTALWGRVLLRGKNNETRVGQVLQTAGINLAFRGSVLLRGKNDETQVGQVLQSAVISLTFRGSVLLRGKNNETRLSRNPNSFSTRTVDFG